MMDITAKNIQRPIVIVLSGVIFLLLLHRQEPFVNGIDGIWAWPWIDQPVTQAFIYLSIPLPLLSLCLYFIYSRPKLHPSITISLLTLCAIGFQILGIYSESAGFSKIESIVLSPFATSYYTDALAIDNLSAWISSFHAQELHLHSLTHPPGPILYHYIFIQIFGHEIAPYAAGISICILASLGVYMIYVFSSLWTDNKQEKLTAAALYTLIPGIILFFPEFDQVYPVLGMAMAYSWMRAINGSTHHLIASAICLAVALSFAYNLLLLGTFYALSGIYIIYESKDRYTASIDLAKRCILLISLVASAYIAIYYLTGYDAIKSFNSALINQVELKDIWDRPHSIALFLNLYDFILGGGILVLPLTIYYAMDLYKNRNAVGHKAISVTMIGWITILITNLSGLLDYETARVWLFLQPFILVPAAIMLANLNKHAIYIIFAIQWLILSSIKSSLTFISA